MIRVDRSRASAPRELATRGKAHLVSTIAPKAMSGALMSKDFDRTIYTSDAVRTRLWEMQRHKCCFCERSYELKFATVEHFRPKTNASDDNHNRGNLRGGYWWLGYEFSNLYFCCQNCNSPKATYFPLVAGAVPLTPSLLPSEGTEQALLLDPGVDDPELHIEWKWVDRRLGYVPVGHTVRGQKTVYATDLDQRDALSTIRADYYRKHVQPVLRAHRGAKRLRDSKAVDAAIADAQRLAAPDAEFAALARFLFRREGML